MTYVFRTVLALTFAANLVGTVVMIENQDVVRELFPNLRPWMIPVLFCATGTSIAGCMILWRWHAAWGFGVLLVGCLTLLGLALFLELPSSQVAAGPASFAVVAVAALPVRRHFREPPPSD
ncbi:MAG: hypothetical protein JRG76_13615 [Deltaproteobacteria bacterium]|nr:hypothetical protein [Deltaproteobacteria bacterium]